MANYIKTKSKQRMKNIKSHLNHGFQYNSKKKKKVGGGHRAPWRNGYSRVRAENTQANIQTPNVFL